MKNNHVNRSYKEDKHFKCAAKKRNLNRKLFQKSHMHHAKRVRFKNKVNSAREFDDVLSTIESGEISDSILNAMSGQTADFMHEVFHQEKVRNSNREDMTIG